MTEPIVIALAAGPSARDTLAAGIMMARLLSAPVVLAGVIVEPAASVTVILPVAVPADAASRRSELAERTLRELAATVPTDVMSSMCLARAPSVSIGLREIVEDAGAGLLVLGASYHGGLARALRGDIASDAIRLLACDVLVVPPRARGRLDRCPHVIGVGWDESEDARVARSVAGDLAVHAEGSVRLVSVADGGNVERELLKASADLDLLVMGSRHRDVLDRLAHRSIAVTMVRQARCPVLVVARPAAAPRPHAPRPAVPSLLPNT